MATNRAQMIDIIAEKASITKTQAKEALKAFTDEVTLTVQAKETLQLKGFGSFAPVERAARAGRNPSTGASIQIPAKTTLKFKPSLDLLKTLNGED